MYELDREELMRVYLAEAEESLATLEEMLVVLESHPEDAETINAIFRAAHTLKGNSASVGHNAPALLAHAMEDLLDEVRAKRFTVTPSFITLMLKSGDACRRLIESSMAGVDELSPEAVSLRIALEAAKAIGVAPDVEERSAIDVESETQDSGAASRRRLRVDLDRLDSILNLTSELSIAAGRLGAAIHTLHERDRQRLDSPSEDLERILGELQQQVTRVRMVPIGPRFDQQRRTIRDLAQSSGKPVRLLTDGHDVEIDASLVDQIKDPLTHMIRNAVDHGVETADVRRARGKNAVATITLRAYHDGGHVVVEVADDGGGFDRERILAHARQRGMVAEGTIPQDDEIYGYVFAPGFTTAEKVTEISGRGVGMDVVSRAIAAMRGSVHVTSKSGEGATIAIRLPLTLAVLRGLVLEAGGERFVIPADAITRCAAVPASESGVESRHQTYGLTEIEQRTVPYIRLRELFAIEHAHAPIVEQMVLIRSQSAEVALVVDGLIGEMQAVIKPLSKVFRKLAGVSSSTIFADGRVGLILDAGELVQRAVRESGIHIQRD
ncbi:MAG: chemotaxis protein CheA [Thermoanaerobaculia bacterium]